MNLNLEFRVIPSLLENTRNSHNAILASFLFSKKWAKSKLSWGENTFWDLATFKYMPKMQNISCENGVSKEFDTAFSFLYQYRKQSSKSTLLKKEYFLSDLHCAFCLDILLNFQFIQYDCWCTEFWIENSVDCMITRLKRIESKIVR